MKKFWNDMDKPLFIISLILFIFGSLNIITSSSSEALSYGHSIYYFFSRQAIILTGGFIIGFVALHMPSKKWSQIVKILYVVVFFMLAYLALSSGNEHRGANNWFSIMGFKVQSSEFMKPILIVMASYFLERYYYVFSDKKANHDKHLAILCLIGGLPVVLIFMANDFGSMLILFLIFASIFFGSYIDKKDKTKTLVIGIIGVIVMCSVLLLTKGRIFSEAQESRFNFINPCSRYESGGYQVCNGFIAINNGGLLGLGIGKSKQKYSYIPEAHTDSVFAIIVEEYGLLFSTLIILSYIFIIYRILKASKEAKTFRGRYICLGVATYIMSHIILNLGGLFGAIPLTGVPLPFISYGGSFGMSLIVSLLLVQRIIVETKRERIKVK